MTEMILKRQLAAKKNRKRGFTLIELIVVIVIIAIIAAIAVPALTRYIGSAEARALQAQAHNVQLVFQAEKSEYYNLAFANAAGPVTSTAPIPIVYTPTTFTYTESYGGILTANGIYLKEGEGVQSIIWEGNTLKSFIIFNGKYWLQYTTTTGFGPVTDRSATALPTPTNVG